MITTELQEKALFGDVHHIKTCLGTASCDDRLRLFQTAVVPAGFAKLVTEAAPRTFGAAKQFFGAVRQFCCRGLGPSAQLDGSHPQATTSGLEALLRQFPAQAWRRRLREAGYSLALGSGPTTDVAPPDDGHFAEEDIDELRQFINPGQP